MDGKEQVARLSDVLGIGALSVLELSADEEERRRLRHLVEEDLEQHVRARFSPKDFAMWDARETGKWSGADRRRIWGAFDYVIIERAQTLGWRIFESVWVRSRIQHWQDGGRDGVSRLRKLFRSVELSAGVSRGTAKLPITERERTAWRNAKKRAVAELRIVFRQHKNEFNQKRRTPTPPEMREWFRSALAESTRPFQFLGRNRESFLRYLDYAQKHDGVLYRQVLLSEATPAAFFDSWAAWSRNLSAESLRQALAKV